MGMVQAGIRLVGMQVYDVLVERQEQTCQQVGCCWGERLWLRQEEEISWAFGEGSEAPHQA